VVDGATVDPLTFSALLGESGFFHTAAMIPAPLGSGLDVIYGLSAPTTLASGILDAVLAAINTSGTTTTGRPGNQTQPGGLGADRIVTAGLDGSVGGDGTGGAEGTFGGPSSDGTKDDKDKNKTDTATGIKKQEDKAIVKKLVSCN
jgi:hypothetical protein